jgi:hypothetical protein
MVSEHSLLQPRPPPSLLFVLLVFFLTNACTSHAAPPPISVLNGRLFLNLTECPLSLRAHQPSVAFADAVFARLAGGSGS